MKAIARVALSCGMELGEDVFSHKNELIMNSGTILDDNAIKKLALYDIVCVSIKEAVDYATTQYERIKFSEDYQSFTKLYDEIMPGFRTILQDYVDKGVAPDVAKIMEIHSRLRNCVKEPERLLDILYNIMPRKDNITFAHSLNASLIAYVFGRWLRLEPKDLTTLVLCGVFYDIGKLKLPFKILWKPDKLTEEEFELMKTHTTLGYSLLCQSGISNHIANSALMHHETFCGNGYPNGLSNTGIDYYARCISIVDSYEAMSSPRMYRASMNSFEVIEAFEKTGVSQYDPQILQPILEHLASSLVGCNILLSDGQKGHVSTVNKAHLSRPYIQLAENHELLNLADDLSLKVAAIL